MAHQFWRLGEAGPDNLGPACTDDGFLLGRTPLIERRDGRFVVRNRDEIGRLFNKVYGAEPSVDRLMSGLATVASALNANDACMARIAAVHLKIPDLPDRAARDAIEAEDSLIKCGYAKGGGGNWNPALHPRTGTPPNPDWFAPIGGGGDSSFWSNVSSTVRDWLQQPVPEYDLETGQVVGERPRWRAIAPYVGAPIATVLAPAAAEIGASATVSVAQRASQIQGALDPIARQMRTTAVLQTDIGRIVAGGARDLAPAQRALLGPGEIGVQAPGVNAEITALNAAANLGAKPLELAVTRPICPHCVAAIQATGGKLTGQAAAIWSLP